MKYRSAHYRLLVAVPLGIALVGRVYAEQPAQQNESGPVIAERLLKIIEAQQSQIDKQQKQLRMQKKDIQNLKQQVKALAGAQGQAKHIAQNKQDSSSADKATSAHASAKARGRHSPMTNAPMDDEWKGSFGVQGINTRFKISGFAEVDMIHDSRAILTPSAFVTSAIVTGPGNKDNKASGGNGQTNFSVQASRLTFETRTPISDHRFDTLVEMDFFNDFSSTMPQLRLRQAYGQVSDILFGGDILAGQAWSTFADLVAIPQVLEFQNVNSLWGTRHPMIRWTKALGKGGGDDVKLALAVEAPDLRQFQGASPVSAWPDGVATLSVDRGPVHVMVAGLVRDLRATFQNGGIATVVGWGAGVTSRIQMPAPIAKDSISVSVTYGEGIGGVFNDIFPDAVYDPATASLNTIPTLGWFASYQHYWTPTLSTNIVYGSLRQKNLEVQAGSSVKRTQYAAANLVWTPWEQWLFGFEVLYGTREDKNGNFGSDVRSQFTSRFTF